MFPDGSPLGVLDRDKPLGVVNELTGTIAGAAETRMVVDRMWVLLTKSRGRALAVGNPPLVGGMRRRCADGILRWMVPNTRNTDPDSANGGQRTPVPRERRSRVSLAEAAEILAGRDPVIAGLLRDTGPPRLPRPRGPHFEALARAIVYQQLAGAAAGAIYGRLVEAAGGEIQAERIVGLSDEQMRAVGLSRAKILSLRDLAAKSLDGAISLSGRALARKSDAEVEEQLRTVRGIGPWTAQVFMMFRLRRLDIWPAADLGVRRGYGLAWGVATPTSRQLEPLGDPYRPYRTVLALYCWRASELRGQGGADLAEPAPS